MEIGYVKANEDVNNKAAIISILSPSIGYTTAQSIVNQWFDNYDEFILNTENGQLIMYKSRLKGDWTKNQEVLENYRFKP